MKAVCVICGQLSEDEACKPCREELEGYGCARSLNGLLVFCDQLGYDAPNHKRCIDETESKRDSVGRIHV